MYTIEPIPPNYSANYLYWPLPDVGRNEIIEVKLDNRANVYLLNFTNYDKYKHGEPFQYHVGGWTTVSPVKIRPPYQGNWYVVVDLGGYPGQVRASTAVIPAG